MESNCGCSTTNSKIRCSVSQCKHNNTASGCCSLNEITVGTHEANPTMPECTDCQSFVLK